MLDLATAKSNLDKALSHLAAAPASAHSYAEAAASPAQMSFTFALPTQVDVPALSGSFGILSAYVPTLLVLNPGVVTSLPRMAQQPSTLCSCWQKVAATLDMLDLATAKSNLDKALSHLAAAPAGMANVEAQINVEAGKALVKALE
uniref:F1F0-ATP synthase delta subunit C-terminal domain-containing protein n=1 Tax=Gopherus agassizii TaxID=38772 RepID=A0A452I7D4_9SAUR